MANLSIRKLKQDAYERLRARAARNGRSMEAELRAIVERAAYEPPIDRKAYAAELRRRRLARSGGKVWKDSSIYIRQDRDSR